MPPSSQGPTRRSPGWSRTPTPLRLWQTGAFRCPSGVARLLTAQAAQESSLAANNPLKLRQHSTACMMSTCGMALLVSSRPAKVRLVSPSLCRLPSGSARSKVLLGIPFYGNEYSFRGKQLERAEAVTSKRLLEVLAQKASPKNSAAAAGPAEAAVSETTGAEQQQQGSCSADGAEQSAAAGGGSCAADGSSGGGGGKRKQRGSRGGLSTTWLDEAGEHLFQWREVAPAPDGSASGKRKREKHKLFFPTPRAVAERLAVAAERGLGVSVWELGQGVEEMAALL